MKGHFEIGFERQGGGDGKNVNKFSERPLKKWNVFHLSLNLPNGKLNRGFNAIKKKLIVMSGKFKKQEKELEEITKFYRS